MSDSSLTPADRMVAMAAGSMGSSPGRMKRPGEAYSCERPTALTKGGKPWSSPQFNSGQPLALPSQRDYAVIGALLKFRASRQLRYSDLVLSDHEIGLIRESCEREPWSGKIDGVWHADYRDGQHVKAILDSTTSGGSYLNPTIFDDVVITYPLLYGEVTPYVEIQDLPRGSSVETVAISTPTVIWNQSEGSEITPFDTTGMISQISATVFPLMVAVEVSRDVLADAAVNLGQYVAQKIGERFQAELDKKIVTGNGSSEPEGMLTASGVGSTASANGSAGPITVGDIENLVFGVGKQYRRDAWSPRFVTSDLMYSRACAVPVGTADARRVFQPDMSHENYTLMHRGVSIQENVSNGTMLFGALKKAYRVWRRQGTETRWSEEGATLMKSNLAILVCRARFAGKVIDPNALHKITDLDQSIAV